MTHSARVVSPVPKHVHFGRIVVSFERGLAAGDQWPHLEVPVPLSPRRRRRAGGTVYSLLVATLAFFLRHMGTLAIWATRAPWHRGVHINNLQAAGV